MGLRFEQDRTHFPRQENDMVLLLAIHPLMDSDQSIQSNYSIANSIPVV